jgi:hypothetical protein
VSCPLDATLKQNQAADRIILSEREKGRARDKAPQRPEQPETLSRQGLRIEGERSSIHIDPTAGRSWPAVGHGTQEGENHPGVPGANYAGDGMRMRCTDSLMPLILVAPFGGTGGTSPLLVGPKFALLSGPPGSGLPVPLVNRRCIESIMP